MSEGFRPYLPISLRAARSWVAVMVLKSPVPALPEMSCLAVAAAATPSRPVTLPAPFRIALSTARPCARATPSTSIGIKLISTCSSTSLSIKVLEIKR